MQTTGDLISVRYEASLAISGSVSRTATEEINLFVDVSRWVGGNAVCSGTDANASNLFQITGGQGDGRVVRIPVSGRFRIVGLNRDTNCGLRTRDPKVNLFHTGAGEAKRMEGYYTGSNDTDTITIGYSGTGNTYVTNAVFRTLGMDMGTFGSVAGEVRLGSTVNSSSADRVNVDTADKVVNYGEFHIGGGTSGMVSSDVTIVGLETFEARANSTIAIYLKASGSGYTGGAVMAGTNVVLYQNASNQRAGVAIVLPANSAFSVGDAFTVDILTARSISGSDGANTLTSSQLQAYLEAVSIDFYRQNADGSRSSLSLGGDAGLFGSLTTRSNGSILTVSWRAEAPMRCSGTTAIRCTGGFGSELQSGLTLATIFARAGVSSITGSGSVTLSGFSTDVNTSSTSANHGIEIDGTDSGSPVTGNLTVNHQTTGTRRTVQVRGERKAALYVKSAASVTVSNAANLVFAEKTGGGYNAGLRGIQADAAANGTASVSNTGNISFAATCTTNCDSVHVGIFSQVASGTGANTVTNSGTITMRPNATTNTSSIGFYLNRGTQTVTNTGNINVDSFAVWLNNPTGASVVNFNGGTVTADTLLNANGSQNVTVTVAGGTATGRLNLAGGDDTVTVNSGGALVLGNGTSDFGGGTDSITVNRDGVLRVGDASNGSDGVSISGLETFTVMSSGTLGLFLSQTGSTFDTALDVSSSTAVTINEGVSIVLNLPVGVTLGSRNAFTIISADNLTVSDAALAQLGSFAVITRGGIELEGTLTFTKSGNNLQVAWGQLSAPTELTCGVAGNAISCVSASDETGRFGMTATAIFNAAGVRAIAGDAVFSLDDFGRTINTEGTGNGIEIDGTAATSRVTGSITVNHQVASVTKHAVQVRSLGRAALYVRSASSATVTNAGNLFFDQVAGSFANTLRALEVRSGGGGSITVSNSGTVGFDTVCTSGCGSNHVGIFANHIGTGIATVSNSGTISIGTGTSTAPNRAIAVSTVGNLNVGNVTVTNTGNIVGGTNSTAIYLAGEYATANDSTVTVNFNGGLVRTGKLVDTQYVTATGVKDPAIAVNVNGGLAKGRLDLGDGDDSVLVNSGGTLNLDGVNAFGSGGDFIRVNGGGALVLGNSTDGSDNATFSGVASTNINANSTLVLYMDSSFTKVTLGGSVSIQGGASAPYIELYLPSGYTIAAKTAFSIIASGLSTPALTVDSATFTGLESRVRIYQGNQNYTGTISFSEASEELQITWGALTADTARTTMTCAHNSGELTCGGGRAGSHEFRRGINLKDVFKGTTGLDSPRTGNLNFDFGGSNLVSDVNLEGTGHGLTADGTVTGSMVSANLTVTNQTGSSVTTKRTIFVRGNNQSALFAKSAANVTVTNSGDLIFDAAGASGNSVTLTGLYAQSGGSGTVSVTNNSGATIGYRGHCIALCSNAHKGIHVTRGNSGGTITISNSGTINVGSGSSSRAIDVEKGSATASITITNSGTIITGGTAVYVSGSGNAMSTINFNDGARVTSGKLVNLNVGTAIININDNAVVSGGVTKSGGGNFTVNLEDGSTWHHDSASSVSTSGTSTIFAKPGGTIVFGSGSTAAANASVTGLDTLDVSPGATLGVHLAYGGGALTGMSLGSDTNLVLRNGSIVAAPTMDIYLPAGMPISQRNAQTALTVITAKEIIVRASANNTNYTALFRETFLQNFLSAATRFFTVDASGRVTQLTPTTVTWRTGTGGSSNNAPLLMLSWFIAAPTTMSCNLAASVISCGYGSAECGGIQTRHGAG